MREKVRKSADHTRWNTNGKAWKANPMERVADLVADMHSSTDRPAERTAILRCILRSCGTPKPRNEYIRFADGVFFRLSDGAVVSRDDLGPGANCYMQ